jgi:DNA-directed RNA polymerase subunit K/omega
MSVKKEYRVEDLDYEKAVDNHGNRYSLVLAAALQHRSENRKRVSGYRTSTMKPLFEQAQQGK